MRLTGRQWQIARLIADGLTSREIAGKLFLSERTVEAHRFSLMKRIGATKAVHVARFVMMYDVEGTPAK